MFWLARVMSLVLLLFAGGTMAHGQENDISGGPFMGSEADPSPRDGANPATPATEVTRIVVVGDAIAGGLGAGMGRMAQPDSSIEIINRFNESSGLARPEVYDWPGALAALLEAKPAQAVVVLVGINDRQTIRDGNMRFPFRSPGWVEAYEKQVDRMIAAAKAGGAKVYWVALPPMAQQELDQDMQALSAIHAARATAQGAQFVDVRKAFLAADGSYTDVGPDDTGVERKLRTRDGISFMRQGNNRFGQLVLAAVKEDLARGGTVTPLPAAPVAPVAAAAPTPGSAPAFGQAGLDGEAITFRADEVTVAAGPVASSAAEVPAANIVLTAKAGSQSELLVVRGIVPAPLPGRFDDFSEPPPAP